MACFCWVSQPPRKCKVTAMAVKKKQVKKKTGATRNTKTEQGSSVFKRIIIISLVGLFVLFLMYLDKIPVEDEKQSGSANKQSGKTASEKNSENKKEKYKFDFYTELSDREVETYKIEEEPAARKIVKKPLKKTIVIDKSKASKAPKTMTTA